MLGDSVDGVDYPTCVSLLMLLLRFLCLCQIVCCCSLVLFVLLVLPMNQFVLYSVFVSVYIKVCLLLSPTFVWYLALGPLFIYCDIIITFSLKCTTFHSILTCCSYNELFLILKVSTSVALKFTMFPSCCCCFFPQFFHRGFIMHTLFIA